jgi:anti-anti-sigma regulatory factor
MATIKLPERCDRAAVETLLPEFVAQQGADRIHIDGEAVIQVGQAMLQLLVSARNSVGQLTLSASQPLRDALALTGLSGTLFDEAQS